MPIDGLSSPKIPSEDEIGKIERIMENGFSADLVFINPLQQNILVWRFFFDMLLVILSSLCMEKIPLEIPVSNMYLHGKIPFKSLKSFWLNL